MARQWNRVGCLTLCALTASAAIRCQGSDDGGPIGPGNTSDGGASDVSTDGATPMSDAASDPAVTPDATLSDVMPPRDVASDTARPDGSGMSDGTGPIDVSSDVIVTDGATDTGGSNGAGGILYPNDAIHSPITAPIAATLRRIAMTGASRNTHNFMKIGDPIMGDALGSPNQVIQGDFFGCVESAAPIKDLATYAALQTTIDYFRQGSIGGKTPFSHVSQCTRENLTSWDLLSENLLPPEITLANPSLGFIMFGSVDIGNGGTFNPSPQGDWKKYRDYAQAMLDIEDALIAAGVVPVIFSMPPRLSNSAPVMQAATFVALTRAIAQGRQTPFIDFHLPLRKLTDLGLESDGLHITQYEVGGGARNCVFTDEGLKHGYNLMNLLGLQALERVKQVVADGATSIDASAPSIEGQGTVDAPFEVPSLPFSDLRDLGKATSKSFESYTGCGSSKESGGEYVYRVNLASPAKVRAIVIDRKGSPVAAHVYRLSSPSAASCVMSQSSNPSSGGLSAGSLAAGMHYFAVDSPSVAAGKVAEYMLVLIECDAADTTCN
ncbi:MAG: hypothetical protein ABW133_19055 [Polyangiaceae bacterium]